MKLLPRDCKSDSDSDDALLEAKRARTRPAFAAKFLAAQSARRAQGDAADAAVNVDDEDLDAEIDAVLDEVASSPIACGDATLIPSSSSAFPPLRPVPPASAPATSQGYEIKRGDSAAVAETPSCLTDVDDLRRPDLPSQYVGYECNVCNKPITCGHRFNGSAAVWILMYAVLAMSAVRRIALSRATKPTIQCLSFPLQA